MSTARITVCNPPKRARIRKALLDVAAAVTEAHVQEAVVQFMELDDWRAIRTDPVSDRERGKGFGELGMPDYLFVRYIAPIGYRGNASVMWIEFKRPGGKPKPHQLDWQISERGRGALVLVVDDIDGFQDWYFKSGLARKVRQNRRAAAE